MAKTVLRVWDLLFEAEVAERASLTKLLLRNGLVPWTASVLCNRCFELGITPYQIRHTWATNAILRGLDLQTIAVLMGHANLTMLSKVYSHLEKRDEHLREAVEKVVA